MSQDQHDKQTMDDSDSVELPCFTAFATDYDITEDWRPPTLWKVYRRRGIRAVVQWKLEQVCVKVINDMHKDAKEHGYNLGRPGYKTPWWFKVISKLEFWCRT